MQKVVSLNMVCAFVGLTAASSASAIGITADEFNAMRAELAPSATVDGSTQSFSIEPVVDDADQLVIGYSVPQQSLLFGVDNDEVFSTGAFFALFDPVITAAIGVVDFGAPSNFAVAVAAPPESTHYHCGRWVAFDLG